MTTVTTSATGVVEVASVFGMEAIVRSLRTDFSANLQFNASNRVESLNWVTGYVTCPVFSVANNHQEFIDRGGIQWYYGCTNTTGENPHLEIYVNESFMQYVEDSIGVLLAAAEEAHSMGYDYFEQGGFTHPVRCKNLVKTVGFFGIDDVREAFVAYENAMDILRDNPISRVHNLTYQEALVIHERTLRHQADMIEEEQISAVRSEKAYLQDLEEFSPLLVNVVDTPIGGIDGIIEEVTGRISKGSKPVKAIRTAFHKAGYVASSSSWESGINSDFILLLNTLKVSCTIDSINDVYANVGTSCMFGKKVGLFYALMGIECFSITDARALVNPADKTFNKIYGVNHYVLEGILVLMGYSYKQNWLGEKIKVLPALSFIPYLDGYIQPGEPDMDDGFANWLDHEDEEPITSPVWGFENDDVDDSIPF